MERSAVNDFSNFGSLKSTEMAQELEEWAHAVDFSNFGSLKSTEIAAAAIASAGASGFQQFRLVEEH